MDSELDGFKGHRTASPDLTSNYDSLSVSNCSESTNQREMSVRRKKRKLHRQYSTQEFLRQPKFPFVQVVKTDIRRNFATMFAKVYNSCDYDTMMDHIHNYYDGGVSIQQRDLRFDVASGLNNLNMSGPQMTGHAVLSEYWYRAMFIAPDQVCNLKHACLTIRSDDTANIKFCFSKVGTKIISSLTENEYEEMNNFLKEKSEVRKTTYFASPKKRVYSDLIPAWVYGDTAPNDIYVDVDELSFSRNSTSSSKASTSSGDFTPREIQAQRTVVFEELTDFESADAVQHYLATTRAADRMKSQQLQQRKPQHRHQHVDRGSSTGHSARRPPPRDWMSLACDAVQCGIIKCRPQREVEESVFNPRVTPAVDPSKFTNKLLPCSDTDSIYIPSPHDKSVLTAEFECTVAVELEFNAACKVVSLVVDLIT